MERFAYVLLLVQRLRNANYEGLKFCVAFACMLEHLIVTYRTCAGVGGMLIGMVAALTVVEMHTRHLPGSNSRG